MKIRSCVWFVCLILCLSSAAKAQVVKVEGGIALSSLVNEGEDMYDKSLFSFQMSVGLDYLDGGWYELSSNLGYLRKGGGFDMLVSMDPGFMRNGNVKFTLDYLTLNTTFRLKTASFSGWNIYVGVGPRIDVNVKRRISTDMLDVLLQDLTPPSVNRFIVGLKCEAGANYSFDRYMLGLNVSYLPSFIKPAQDFIAHDQTFTVGISLGYRL